MQHSVFGGLHGAVAGVDRAMGEWGDGWQMWFIALCNNEVSQRVLPEHAGVHRNLGGLSLVDKHGNTHGGMVQGVQVCGFVQCIQLA